MKAALALPLLVVVSAFTTSGPPPPLGVTSNLSAPLGPPGPWRLSFDDEFAGTAPNPAVWSTCYRWGCTNSGNYELEWYLPGQVSVSSGALHLSARRERTHGKAYASGMIQTYGNYTFRYGYVEARARLPRGRGMWSSIWTMAADRTWPPEIDVVENWSQPPDTIDMTVHYGKDQQASAQLTGPDFTAGYHTFGVDWEPGGLTWYVDGVARQHVAVSITKPQYLLANLAVDGSDPPGPSARLSPLSIDWIRVWQHPPRPRR